MAYTGTAATTTVLTGGGTYVANGAIYFTSISFDSGSHTLSAYVNGTYTPSVLGSSSNPTVAYTTQVGFYIQFGALIVASTHMLLSSISGGSGNAQASALPFTSNSTSSSATQGGAFLAPVTNGTSVTYYTTLLSANSTVCTFQGSVSNAAEVLLAVSGISSTTNIAFTVSYST